MKKYVVGFILILFPILGFADSTTSALSFTPPPTDYSIVFLGNLFGRVDGVLYGSGSQIMGAIFKVFNSAVLALGGIIIMYILLVSTMNTAHQGEMMGKWSSIWVPMRATIGLALLIPQASGYCLMQIFVMWIVVQGVGAADKVWAAALNYLNRGGTIVQAQVDPVPGIMANATDGGDAGQLMIGAQNILAGQVCMLGLQRQLENQRETYKAQEQTGAGPCIGATGAMKAFCDTPVPDFLNSVNMTSKAASNSVDMPNFEDAPYNNLTGVCGVIKWNDLDTSNANKVGTLSSNDLDFVSQTRVLALQQMYLELDPVARVMVNNSGEINTNIVPVDSNGNPNWNMLFTPWAKYSYGMPYDTSGGVCSDGTMGTQECNNWGPAPAINEGTNPGVLFTGMELRNALSTYNGIMMPTLTLLQQADEVHTVCYGRDGLIPVDCDSDQVSTRMEVNEASDNRKFIQATKDSGWITAGSYFFKIIRLSQAAVTGGKLVDEDHGIGNTEGPSSSTLLESFGPNSCVDNATASNLCIWFNKDPTKIEQVLNLVGEPEDEMAQEGASATAYGFTGNSTYLTLPGQPAGRDLSKQKYSSKITLGSSELKKMKFNNIKCEINKRVLGAKIKVCALRQFTDVMYNTVFRGFWNNIVAMINPIFDKMFFAIVSMPADAMKEIFQVGLKFLNSSEANPVVSLAQMGTYFINFAGQYWLFAMEIGVLASKVPYFGIVFLIFFGLALPIITAWVAMMVSIGVITAYYIPFLPYMIFTFGSIAWLIAVIEAMVAAPIMALGITHPEGHEAFGKGEQGIMILMNIFLRPSMMIIGFIAGIALSYVGVWILNAGFDNAIAFMRGDLIPIEQQGKEASALGTLMGVGAPGGYTNWAGLFGYIFGIIAYVSMYMVIVQKSFSLIAVLPDQVLRWIGGQAERQGQEAGQWAEESKGKIEQGGQETDKAKGEIATKTAGMIGKGFSGLKSLSDGAKGAASSPEIKLTEGTGKEGSGEGGGDKK